MASFPRRTSVSRYQKSRTIPDFNEARDDTVAVASAGPYANKSFALHSGQITTPASRHSISYWSDALLAAQATVSKH